jgi:hypothetical protein
MGPVHALTLPALFINQLPMSIHQQAAIQARLNLDFVMSLPWWGQVLALEASCTQHAFIQVQQVLRVSYPREAVQAVLLKPRLLLHQVQGSGAAGCRAG